MEIATKQRDLVNLHPTPKYGLIIQGTSLLRTESREKKAFKDLLNEQGRIPENLVEKVANLIIVTNPKLSNIYKLWGPQNPETSVSKMGYNVSVEVIITPDPNGATDQTLTEINVYNVFLSERETKIYEKLRQLSFSIALSPEGILFTTDHNLDTTHVDV